MDKFKQFLQSIAPISDEQFIASKSFFTKKKLNRKDFLVRQNQVCPNISFILSGTIRIYYLNEKSEEITSCFCTQNNFTTSYKSFVLREPSNLILQAITETELLMISYEQLQKLYNIHPVWQTIGRKVAEQEYFTMERYASILNNETAKEKYLRLLKEQPEVIQVANIEDIATYLGVTRRTLSRIRQEISD